MSTVPWSVVARQDLPGLAFSCLRYEPRVTLEWHVHPLAYLSFVGAGSYTERVDRRTRLCGTSTLLLHAAGERHANVFHDERVRLLRVESTDAQLFALAGNPAHSEAYRGLSAAHLCRRMLHELQSPDDVTPLALHGLLLELVAVVARAAFRCESREPAWLARVDDFVQATYDSPVSLATIAAHAGVHPVHLARTYRRHRRRTIGDRIRELRLERACRLLATTRESVAGIASRCGFSDQSHLARLMRATLGLTPTQYRAERALR